VRVMKLRFLLSAGGCRDRVIQSPLSRLCARAPMLTSVRQKMKKDGISAPPAPNRLQKVKSSNRANEPIHGGLS